MEHYSRERALSGQFRFRLRIANSQLKELQSYADLVVAHSLGVALLGCPARTP